MNKLIALALASGAVVVAAPALAAAPDPVVDCSVSGLDDITPAALACAGYYSGNYLRNPQWDDQVLILEDLGLDISGQSWSYFDDNWKFDVSGNSITFGSGGIPTISGMTWIGLHVGGGQNFPTGGQGSVFYRFDAGDGLGTLTFNDYGALSSLVIYATGGDTPAVPEPASWAMMIGGLGLAGAMLRGRSRSAVSFS
ncbi:PEPxxWA-CTERM sorting domain-containing protein [Sphingobium lignivorans]|uniref:Ice-binding protein C-terminal domain-containing protein n=1 Tax=Sphingobium lignivorans TaxID=2735886 RepID=A0ABR6NJC5_9SPHN|nr:PEPxxWA-CTERM sorting domain-containing protein [Sphingobium lignivorans]MBB5987379.1 hypothetical protein [Sphingobium lignivorans]